MIKKIECYMRYYCIGLAIDLFEILYGMVDTINDLCVCLGLFGEDFYRDNIYTLYKNKQTFCKYMADRI